jgi:hypothetical protein
MICYGELRFPHRAVFLLALESDAACFSLNGYFARTSAVLVLELEVIGNKICEGIDCLQAALSSGTGCSTSKWTVF